MQFLTESIRGCIVSVLSISGMGLVQPMITRWVIDDILRERYAFTACRFGYGGCRYHHRCLQYLQRYSMAYVGHKVIYE